MNAMELTHQIRQALLDGNTDILFETPDGTAYEVTDLKREGDVLVMRGVDTDA